VLHKLGLRRDIDLALHLPLRYEDETRLVPLDALVDAQSAQVEGVIADAQLQFRPRRMLLVTLAPPPEAAARHGRLLLRFFNFYPSQQKALAPGARIRARGEVRFGRHGPEMTHPSFSVVAADTPLKPQLTPVYPTAAGLPQAYLRRAVHAALGRVRLDDTVPADWLPQPSAWPSLRDALHLLHQPPPDAPLEALQARTHPAWMRLKIDELVAQQLSHLRAVDERRRQAAPPIDRAAARAEAPRWAGLVERLQASLPFRPTAAQQRVVEEIVADLRAARPMHRLLQGDVGSGKTLVAAMAAAHCIEAGFQCALMAPTETLAEQTFGKLVALLEPLGVEVAWLSGSLTRGARSRALAAAEQGSARLVVGTHAVIGERVRFAELGLAIVDEQHRFGVLQRLALRSKGAAGDDGAPLVPHLLTMSATPIPRTLAMSYYGDLDVSVIDELPPGRSPIVTRLYDDTRRAELVERLAEQVRHGRQAYWVCPLVEDSEALDLQNALAVHQELSARLQPAMVVLLHGRMPPADKRAAMTLFADGTAAVMVATSVIEVGVDVPNASLMVVEHAERFGLAQLHQLRGRVGRGSTASACLLLYTSPLSPSARERLRAMRETQDGFEIARRDLQIRGPGELLGARQSGVPLLRFADLQADADLIPLARRLAARLLREQPAAAERHLQRWLPGGESMLSA
jgi:ATP-dependent DNA helicase RecG